MLLRQIRQCIDRALQYMGSRKRIDLVGPLRPADVRLDHCPFHRLGGPSLVPQEDRQLQRGKVAGEGADGLGSRRIGSVHVERQSQDQARNAFPFNELSKRFEIRRELGPADGFGWTGEAPPGIAEGKPHRFRPDVEAGELAVGDGPGEIGGVGRNQRCHALNLRSASFLIADQNKA